MPSSPWEPNELKFGMRGFYHQPNNLRGWWVKFEKKNVFFNNPDNLTTFDNLSLNLQYSTVKYLLTRLICLYQTTVKKICKMMQKLNLKISSLDGGNKLTLNPAKSNVIMIVSKEIKQNSENFKTKNSNFCLTSMIKCLWIRLTTLTCTQHKQINMQN